LFNSFFLTNFPKKNIKKKSMHIKKFIIFLRLFFVYSQALTIYFFKLIFFHISDHQKMNFPYKEKKIKIPTKF